ncbi:hypothetical protein [Corynebacterium diphtheriae]|uniref:hypothetical protein n=5 Tax=Corynebacterium diphtheriae TaxID=1717 RepID=UPI0008FB9731|nr:hypothetical protein [Corynebacterium diphtheriae]OIR64666.1 hypothetical protein BHF76_11425 [Corynebacterium diphtheriae]CAB0713375.1 hypothetical protein FRC0049_02063 [Corynebacterium diphtheriae]CAB0713869.1 hypothetical protein FRC0050_02086 [Corynebacterium diphtheriae]CAB1009823.1 hypothetical protein FRC0508_02136 [Corynebacterium diphtheriae]
MFKRSLASVAAVAIASGAVVAPANAVAVKVNNDMTCTFSLTAEETKLTTLKSNKYSKEKITNLKLVVGSQPSALRAQIEKDKKALTKLGPNDEQRKHLTNKLKEDEKKLTAYENLNNALDACIAGKYYNSDNLGDSKKPDGPQKPGPNNPGDSNNPDGPQKPGPNNPGVQPAPPSNDGAGIGVIFAASIAAVLGILAAALPFIKSILPPQLRALLP